MSTPEEQALLDTVLKIDPAALLRLTQWMFGTGEQPQAVEELRVIHARLVAAQESRIAPNGDEA